jgi:hypothetical protein
MAKIPTDRGDRRLLVSSAWRQIEFSGDELLECTLGVEMPLSANADPETGYKTV